MSAEVKIVATTVGGERTQGMQILFLFLIEVLSEGGNLPNLFTCNLCTFLFTFHLIKKPLWKSSSFCTLAPFCCPLPSSCPYRAAAFLFVLFWNNLKFTEKLQNIKNSSYTLFNQILQLLTLYYIWFISLSLYIY